MKRYLLFAIVVMTSCYSSSKKDDSQQKDNLSDIRSILSNYSLPYRDSITDENTFVFYKEQRWDTSFVLTLRKDTSLIIGVYHEVSPDNMEAGYLTEVGFFDGFTFAIDSVTWDKVIRESRSLLDSINHVPYTGCVDCGQYILSHDGKFTLNSGKKHNVAFKDYEKFLRQTLVYPVFKKKKALKEGAVPKE
jgi:hypothetical protein